MTSSTFTDRLLKATDGMPRGFQARMAEACGVRPPSVNAWLTGETKTVSAEVVFPLARFLNVNPEWLATGRGPMQSADQEGVKDSRPLSHPLRLDAETMRKALLFSRTFLGARGMAGPVDAYPDLLALAVEIISTLEASDESEVAEVMRRMAERTAGRPNDEQTAGRGHREVGT